MRTLLIANRGEIAVRIARTARRLGLRTVAVHSPADDDALHVHACDVAVRLGPDSTPRGSYLRVELLLAAARRAGADAVHPGYGFLSEDAGFARAVLDAGLTWVGPAPEAIAAMGSKRAARALAAELGVPVLPGTDQVTAEHAAGVGYPLLVKASAGGGGRGMRRVERWEELDAAVASAGREALAAFGDGTLLLERLATRARHVEVQVFGDLHGRVVHYNERDCSVQRRHQKVVEEAPGPHVDAALREHLGEAAVRLASHLGYSSAGTVEFLLEPDGRFWFLEMNTRLQVEHPVTEATTGLDLVEAQLRVADGQRVPDPRPPQGHALEVRVYAEDPDAGYAPQSGRLLDWHLPERPGLRIDSGVRAGDAVSSFYDPMLAKVIAYAEDRERARTALVGALEDFSALGVRTNVDHLLRILRHPEFAAGRVHTGFLEEHALRPEPEGSRGRLARAVVAVAELTGRPRRLPGVPRGFRNHRYRDPTVRVDGVDVPWRESLDGLVVDGWEAQVLARRRAGREATELRVRIDGVTRRWRVAAADDAWWVHGAGGVQRLTREPDFPEVAAEVEAAGARAPMPGRVTAVLVVPGEVVEKGQPLVVIEAMKTEHTLTAGHPGTVIQVRAAIGEQVEAGALLVDVHA